MVEGKRETGELKEKDGKNGEDSFERGEKFIQRAEQVVLKERKNIEEVFKEIIDLLQRNPQPYNIKSARC